MQYIVKQEIRKKVGTLTKPSVEERTKIKIMKEGKNEKTKMKQSRIVDPLKPHYIIPHNNKTSSVILIKMPKVFEDGMQYAER